jgi:DNA helicase-2/ATP-dependent DNA helicase PcrA
LGKTRSKKFSESASKIRGKAENLTTLELLDKVLEETGYLDLYDPKNEEDLMRLENIKELRSVATEFPKILEFLENVALVQQEYLPNRPLTNGQKNAVTLMTAHAAKGLEFPVVFIVGMEEGLFPHSSSLLDPLEIEEERRLAYVGITRAKEKLFLSFALRRFYFGKHSSNMISRFISDIPEHLLEMVQ